MTTAYRTYIFYDFIMFNLKVKTNTREHCRGCLETRHSWAKTMAKLTNKYPLNKYALLGSRQFLLSLTVVKSVNKYAYTYMCITAVNEKRGMGMKKNREGT